MFNDKIIFLSFLAAFFALVFSAIIYSVLAGEPFPQAQGRAATEELIDGLPFGLSIMMLFHGVALLIDNGNIGKAAIWLARIIAVVAAPVIIATFLVSGTADTEAVRLSEQGVKLACIGSIPPPKFGIAVIVALIIISFLSVTIGRQTLMLRAWVRELQGIPPAVVVVISVSTTLISGFINGRSDNFIMSPITLDIYLAFVGIVLAFMAIIMAIGSGRFDQSIAANVDDEKKIGEVAVIIPEPTVDSKPEVLDISSTDPSSYEGSVSSLIATRLAKLLVTWAATRRKS